MCTFVDEGLLRQWTGIVLVLRTAQKKMKASLFAVSAPTNHIITRFQMENFIIFLTGKYGIDIFGRKTLQLIVCFLIGDTTLLWSIHNNAL